MRDVHGPEEIGDAGSAELMEAIDSYQVGAEA
jgi:hypothetical protein